MYKQIAMLCVWQSTWEYSTDAEARVYPQKEEYKELIARPAPPSVLQAPESAMNHCSLAALPAAKSSTSCWPSKMPRFGCFISNGPFRSQRDLPLKPSVTIFKLQGSHQHFNVLQSSKSVMLACVLTTNEDLSPQVHEPAFRQRSQVSSVRAL